MLANRITYVFLFLFSFLLLIFTESWYAWFLFLLFIILPVFSLLLCLFARRKTQIHLRMPSRTEQGNERFLSVLCSGKSIFFSAHAYVVLKIYHSITGIEDRETLLVPCDSSVELELDTNCCGVIHVTPVRFSICDMLGLFRIRADGGKEKTMIILPKPEIMCPAPDITKMRSVVFRPKVSGGFSEIREIREYRPGDRLRSVHWKLSAKSSKLLVNEPQEPVHGSLVITVDTGRNENECSILYGRLLWLSNKLLDAGMEHDVRFMDTDSLQCVRMTVKCEKTLLEMLSVLLDIAPSDSVMPTFPPLAPGTRSCSVSLSGKEDIL